MKTKSSHALAASQIKAELKKAFPSIKFSIKSKSYSGGNSIIVKYVDAVPVNKIEEIVNKYQYGHFNGMEDIYEYSNSREDISQVKYVFVNREMSENTKNLLVEKVKKEWANMDDFTGNGWHKVYGNEGSFLYREFAKTDFTNN